MEELRMKLAQKNAEFREKYKDQIYAIAMKWGVDMGIAFDMLKAVARGGNYAEGIELDIAELKADYYEITCISTEIAQLCGTI